MQNSQQKYLIQPHHDILTVTLRGSWNAEDSLSFVSDYKKLVNHYFAREWACVFNLKQMEMLIPDAYQVHTFRALNTWSYIKGMQALVVLFSQNSRSQLLYQFEEILEDRQAYQRKVCQSEAEGYQWLADQGFRERVAEREQRSA